MPHRCGVFGGSVAPGRRVEQGGRGQTSIICRAGYVPYPFAESDYYRASLQLVQVADGSSGVGQASGHLLLMREGPRGIEDAERGLVLAVGGDTLSGIALLMQGKEGERPLSLDLLWTVLQRGRQLSKRDWSLQRVAIVELRGSAYIGRLFFGGDAPGAPAWDCDCRPSDGCWFSLKEKCPIYIHRRVWEENSTALKELARREPEPPAASRRVAAPGAAAASPESGALPPDTSAAFQVTAIREGDPELLRRLKMEMRVALRDEDYVAATRLRDHPFMRLHARIAAAEAAGDADQAARLTDELATSIAMYERTGVVPDSLTPPPPSDGGSKGP